MEQIIKPLIGCEEAVKMMKETSEYVENILKIIRPDLLNMFNTYSNEAIQSRKILNQDLLKLNYGDAILEVGAGILALATQLSREGFKVTAVEPVQDGFTEINFIMNQYVMIGKDTVGSFELIRSKIESIDFINKFNYIFAVNVIEHVENPYEIVLKLYNDLKENCGMRILCPNYDFPYEPHFGRCIILRKNKAFFDTYHNLTKGKNIGSGTLELYESLNFISYKKLISFLIANNIKYETNKIIFYEIILRSLNDQILANRHVRVYSLVRVLHTFRLTKLIKLFPFRYAPVIDVKLIK